MAKTQTFGDKLKKGKHIDNRINVKVIKGFKCENRNSIRFIAKMVKVDDLNQLDKIDISL